MTGSKYEMIIYWSERDKAFLVEVPELPGCVADGEIPEEAIKMSTKSFGFGSKQQEIWGGKFQNRGDVWLTHKT